MTGRPISPHIGIYRWYLTMALSIGHRVSGSALAVFILGLTWWLVALASGQAPFDQVHGLAGSVFGRLVLFGLSFIVFYHMANGVRHLAWDTGRGFEPRTARMTGQLVLVVAGVMTAVLWLGIVVLQ